MMVRARAAGRALTSRVALVDSDLHSLIAEGSFELSGVGLGALGAFVQPASLDIPVGRRCLLLRDKALPFRRRVEALLVEEDMVLEERVVEAGGSFLLLKGQTYLFPCGRVSLAEHLEGSLSPKSSIGRVDLMVRGVFDHCGLYDTVRGSGELWMEVSPRSFNVRVSSGQALSQMMVFDDSRESCVAAPARSPSPSPSPLGSGSSSGSGPPSPSPSRLLTPLEEPLEELAFDAAGNALPLQMHRGALVLTLNLHPCASGLVGFEALATNAVVDLRSAGAHAKEDFFRPILLGAERHSLTLEKDKFYVLSTKEKVRIPTHLSAEMVPFSQHVGELRAHYAGFFDPGFGYGLAGEIKGTVGVLEVRPHETITVCDGQPICMMEFFRNSKRPDKPYGSAGNNYQGQSGPKLAKYFK
jgi:dCTP deaminase